MQSSHINYLEFQASDLGTIKQFYQNAFDWKFTDYGPEYTAFSESGSIIYHFVLAGTCACHAWPYTT